MNLAMSVIDYTQSAEDHRTLLILVKQIGSQISPKTFNKVFEKISRVQQVRIQESGVVRNVWLRYKKSYPVESNDWGDFQTHRKVLGLISVGKCSNQNDVKDLCAEHNTLQEKYGSTLYDSRCLVFGMDCSPSSCSSSKMSIESENLASPESVQSSYVPNGENEVFKTDETDSVPKNCVVSSDKDSGMYEQPYSLETESLSNGTSLQSGSTTLTSLDSTDLPNVNIIKSPKFPSVSDKQVSRDISLSSLCSSNSSESPTVDRLSPATGSQKLMIPPTAVKSRSTHCILYPGVDSCEQLEHDINEFISSLFWVLESKHLDQSFEKQEKVPLLTAAFEKKDFVGIDTDTRVYKKRCIGRMKKHIADLALQSGLPVEALSLYSAAYELLKSVNDWLWLAATFEGQCAASIVLSYPMQSRVTQLHRNSSLPLGMHASKAKVINSRSLPNGSDPVEMKNMGKNILSADDIVEKYREAITHYRKYHNASVIELECSIKAARFLSMQERYLEASEFLQNLYMVLPHNDYDKMLRFDALSQLYSEIGFHRKASFFKRLAAMKSVSQANPNPSWQQCYRLMLQALNGYKLSLDPKEFPKDIMYGWPGIQIQTLEDLVKIAKQMNNQDLAVRHMSFLLHTLMEYLTQSEQRDFCSELETLTANCEGAPVPLALDSGVVIPPVNFLNLPQVKSFKLQNLAPHLRPVKMVSNNLKSDPDPPIFIFSPIPRDRDRLSKDTNRLNFKWVEGDVCEVALQVFNPLSYELKVTHMSLLADGIAFESFPACLSLPAESGPYPVNLLGTPLGTGELKILGYSTHVLGVKSNCRLREIPAIKRPFFSIDVIPKLPLINVTTSLPKASTFSSLGDTSYVVMSAAVTMYAGESHECTVTITNIGKEPVERVDLSLHTKLDKDKESSFFIWSKENLDTQLPIAVDSSASFTLYINAIGEFVSDTKTNTDTSSLHPSSARGSRSSSTSSLTSTPNRRRLPVTTPEPFPPKTVEAVLQLQYTGGPGMAAEYCRQCALAITVEVLPSVVITKWDVLPAEIPSHCYLVLDVLNSTTHEMELQYAANKRILIEAQDTCRIPVPVERCPLSVPPSDESHPEVNDQQRKQRLVKACRDHLVNLVDLQWTLTSLDVSGRASVAEVTWSDAMLDIILMSPIQWDILLNGRLFKVEDEFNFVVGDLITLSITLRNTSDIALHSLYLCVRGYQDHQNGHRNYRLETKRAVVGSDKVFIKDILPHEDYCHECGFVFFHTGNYKLDVFCTSKDHQGIWPHSPAKATGHVSRGAEKGEQSRHNPSWDSNQNSHVWKCSPSIDITIVED